MTDKIKKLLPILFFFLALATFFWCGWIGNEWKNTARIEAIRAEAAETAAKAEKSAREAEQAHAQDIAQIDKTYTEKLRHVQQKNKADLAALRSGALQLHNRFICPNAGGVVSETGTGTSMGDGTGRGGLRTEDAEFLVSESDRADEIVIRLQACQQLLSADRKLTER